MSTPWTRPVGSDPLGRQEGVQARAAAQVQHRLAGLQFGQGRGIATGKAEIGTFRQGGKFGVRVADALGDLVGAAAAAARGLGAAAAATNAGDLP